MQKPIPFFFFLSLVVNTFPSALNDVRLYVQVFLFFFPCVFFFQLGSRCCFSPLLFLWVFWGFLFKPMLWFQASELIGVFKKRMWCGATSRLSPQLRNLCWGRLRACVCVRESGRFYDYSGEKGSKSYRSIIAIMIIMITIILPVYCNIIDALVRVTSLIFLQTTTLMKWFIKQSHESWSFRRRMKTTATND